MTDLGLRSATELLASLDAGEASSRELLDHLLARVEKHNPGVNAVVTLDADRATEEAAAADDARARGERLGPLHGLPMTVKDVMATAGLRTTSGSKEQADHVPSRDATSVARLRAAGAVIFGKTNTPRYAADLQTYNDVFGITRNPWALDRTTGGSSGGSAAALAAGLTPLELGTDIAGSIRNPSHMCGVFGHKPSYGIVPADGYVSGLPLENVASDVNVIGPLARSVRDLRLALDVLGGAGGGDAAGWHLDLPPARNAGLGSYRIAAWLDDPAAPVDPEVGDVLQAAVERLREHGAHVADAARPELDMTDAIRVFQTLLFAAMAPWLDESLGLGAYPHGDWLKVNGQRQGHRWAWARFFRAYDALLAPVLPVAAFPHDVADNPLGMAGRTVPVAGAEVSHGDLIHWCGVFGVSYLPSTVVPAGRTPDGRPVGMQIVGPYLEDHTTLDLAARISEVLGGFEAPPGY